MSLPAETKFPCCACPETDSLKIGWDASSYVYIESRDPDGYTEIALNRSQVESLRDQLTAWLEITK